MSVSYFCALVLFLVLVDGRNVNVLRKRDLGIRNECARLHLELLVSPLVGKGVIRRLELQWEYAPAKSGDWIGVFATDPLAPRHYGNLPPLLDAITVDSVHGWANSTVFEQHIEPEFLGYYGRCLNYYAAYLDSENRILTATCLRVEPNWMWNLKQEIGPRRLRQIFIPGTHDSSAYGEYNENVGDTIVKKYSITQDEDVLGQLIYGARYIDLRVGYYGSNREPWWGNHGMVKLHPIRVIFRDLKEFLNSTQEIVILDIQEFPVGFGKDLTVHQLFVQFLEEELGDYTTPPALGWDTTLDAIWRTGRRLIIGYDHVEMVSQSTFLWPAVQQRWGNVRTLPDLYVYLSGVIERPPQAAWSAMAELTPSTLDVILDRLKGLRAMAESVNHNVTDWFREGNWQPKTNVVAVDFIRNTGIVRAAIEYNKFQGQCQRY